MQWAKLILGQGQDLILFWRVKSLRLVKEKKKEKTFLPGMINYGVTSISLSTKFPIHITCHHIQNLWSFHTVWRLLTILNSHLQLSACMRQKARNLHIGSWQMFQHCAQDRQCTWQIPHRNQMNYILYRTMTNPCGSVFHFRLLGVKSSLQNAGITAFLDTAGAEHTSLLRSRNYMLAYLLNADFSTSSMAETRVPTESEPQFPTARPRLHTN